MNCLIKLKGFIEKDILPEGYAKTGEWFGESLALPTGFFFAKESGKTSN